MTNSDLAIANETNMDTVANVSYLSDTQETLLAFIPIVPALISLTASCMLIRLLHKRGFKTPMRRILLALGLSDIFTAITATLQSFLVPEETSRRLFAVGNNASCSFLGWSFTFSMISFLYFAALSLYFLMVVKYGMKDSVFARKIEPYIHVSILVFSLSTATIGLGMGLYGEVEVGAGCWLRPTEDCDGECIDRYQGMFGGIPFGLCLAMVTVSNILIFLHVRTTVYENIKKSRERWKENLNNLRISLSISKRVDILSSSLRNSSAQSMRRDGSSGPFSMRSNKSGPLSMRSNNSMTMSEAARRGAEKAARKEEKRRIKEEKKRLKEHLKAAAAAARKAKQLAQQKAREKLVKQVTASPEQKTRVKRVGMQSLLYCVVFLITYSWTTVLILYVSNSENGGSPEMEATIFPLMLLRSVFIPFMGLWNLLVYVRPRYCTLRDQEEAKENGESSWKSFRRVLWDVDAGIIGRGSSHRGRYSQASARSRRVGSTKTQFYKGGVSSNSTLGSSTDTLPTPGIMPKRGESTQTPMRGPPMPILEQGESQHTQIGGPPSTILERGESQHTQLGGSQSNFSQDFSVSSFASFGISTELTAPPTRQSINFTQSGGAMTSLSSLTELAEPPTRQSIEFNQSVGAETSATLATQRDDSLSQDDFSDDH